MFNIFFISGWVWDFSNAWQNLCTESLFFTSFGFFKNFTINGFNSESLVPILNKFEYGLKKQYDVISDFSLLTTPQEREIINQLHIYAHTLKNIAKSYEVNKLTLYLYNLAKTFHAFYANNKVIIDTDETLSRQRYWLCYCVKQVIANGLKLMSIQPLDKM